MYEMFANYSNFLNYIKIDKVTIYNFLKYRYNEKYPKSKLIRLQMVIDDFIMSPDEFVDGINKILNKDYSLESLDIKMEEIYLLMKEKGEYPTIDEIANFNVLFSNFNLN